MRQYQVTTASDVVSVIAVTGDFIRLEDSMPDTVIEVIEAKNDSKRIVGNRISLKAGDAFKFNGKYTRLGLTQSSGASVIVRITAGEGQLIASRISGTVDSVNDSYNERMALAEQAFTCTMYMSGTTNKTGNGINHYGIAQLWNPLASGYNVIVESFGVRHNLPEADMDFANQLINYTAYNTDFEIAEVNEVASLFRNKKSGGAAPVAEVRGSAQVGIYSASLGVGNKLAVVCSRCYDSVVAPGKSEVLEKVFESPVIIEPGYGFTIIHGPSLVIAAAEKIHTYVDWKEKAV